MAALKVNDVPADRFCSISVYNKDGDFAKNDVGAHSVNNLTAKTDSDGTITIQFGGDPKGASNYLPISPGWNDVVRLDRPHKEILDGSWKFPLAEPIW